MNANIDIVDVCATYLQEHGFTDALKRRLDSTTGREAIIVRRLPTLSEATYMDGSQTLGYLYQIIVRRKSEEDAMTTCSDIAELLSDAYLPSANGSYVFTSQEIYTYPQELRLEEQGFYAWETRIHATIERSAQ
jgi:hypothetical protein